ncbi:unnamed protein product [Sphagnum jensenii]
MSTSRNLEKFSTPENWRVFVASVRKQTGANAGNGPLLLENYYQYRKISVDRLENQFDSQGDKSRLERERIEAYRRSFDFPDSHRCVPLFEARSRVEETAADRDRGKNCFLCSVRQCYYRKIFGRLSRVRIRQPRGEQTETEKIEAYRSSSSFPHSHR